MPLMFLSDGMDSAMASFIDLPAPIAVEAMNRKSLNSAIYLLRRLSIRLSSTKLLIFFENGSITTAKNMFLYIRYETASPAAASPSQNSASSFLLKLYFLRSVMTPSLHPVYLNRREYQHIRSLSVFPCRKGSCL